MQTTTFAQKAAGPAQPIQTHPIPTGSWTVYFHEPEDKSWTPDSYKRLQGVNSWEELGSLLREIGTHRLVNGMMFSMRGTTSPLWENKANIRGGSYCLKISHKNASEVYHRYLTAAAAGIASNNPTNAIVGVTMSPKKGFCIIKLWNTDAKAFHRPQEDIPAFHEEVNLAEVLYRPHTEQKM